MVRELLSGIIPESEWLVACWNKGLPKKDVHVKLKSESMAPVL